jgi:hypothetical protein
MFDAVLVNVSCPMRDDLVREFFDTGRAVRPVLAPDRCRATMITWSLSGMRSKPSATGVTMA